MINYINMEVVQALNPLYAVPIVAVIVCAFIVYFFGFKSPVQPPSFDGIEEERKSTKKRRAKESHKGKSLQNGKLSESTVHKVQNASAGKKKDAHEKAHVNADKATVPTEKTSGHAEKATKTAISEKAELKAAKRARQLSEKKDAQVKKNEPVIQDDNNDDGWVQLISKKGRKNRKKEESTSKSENQVNTSKSQQAKKVEIEISDAAESNDPIEIKTDIIEMVPTLDAKSQRKTKQVKEEAKEETPAESESVKVKNQSSVVSGKNGSNSVEKQIPPEKKAAESKAVAKLIEVSTEIEDSKIKSKKKKKKTSEPAPQENVSENSVSESPAIQDVQKTTEMTISSTNQPKVDVIGKKDVHQPPEMKPSNVVFDELAGLYPEEKEQRRRKKVRRDH